MAAIRRRDRGGEWWVDFRHGGTRLRKRAPVQSRRGAEQYERGLRQNLVASDEIGRPSLIEASPIFAVFAVDWMSAYVTATNRSSSKYSKERALATHLLPAFGNLKLHEITTARIDCFAAELRTRGRRPKTVNNLLSMLRCALTTAAEWGLLREVPKFRWQRVPTSAYRYLQADESRQLLEAAPAQFWRTLLLFLLRTGARFGEAAALTWDHVHLDVPVPFVRLVVAASRGEVGPTKTGRVRDVPLAADLALALRAHRHDDHPLVFWIRPNYHMKPDTAQHHLSKIALFVENRASEFMRLSSSGPANQGR